TTDPSEIFGTIAINLNPDSINALWTLTGPNNYEEDGNVDTLLSNMKIGDYTVTWGDITGWATPLSEMKSLVSDSMVTFSGDYIENSGVIFIVIDSAIDESYMPWTLTGPNNYSLDEIGDMTLGGLAFGDYTITWLPVLGWVEPASETKTLLPDSTLVFIGNYVEDTGVIFIDPSPDYIEAPWSLVGPNWYRNSSNGDTTLVDLEYGYYAIIWEELPGWISPPSENKTLVADSSLTFKGLYIQNIGTIIVDSSPDDIDAPWSLSGPHGYQEVSSGDQTFHELDTGEYTITWLEVDGWITPDQESETLDLVDTLVFSGNYIVDSGAVVVNPHPTWLNAQWVLNGPDDGVWSGEGAMTFPDMVSGDYIISWDDIGGWITPFRNTELTLIAGDTLTFEGIYIEEYPGPSPPPMIQVSAGSFIMGDGYSYCGEDEREVTLTRDFYLGQHEVTNQEYLEALQWAYDHGHVTVADSWVLDNLDWGSLPLLVIDGTNTEILFDGAGTFYLRESQSYEAQDAYPEGYDPSNHPVKLVSWYGAARYCDWLNLLEGLPRAYEHTGDWSCNGGDPYGVEGYRLPTDAEWEFAAQFDDGRIYPWGNEDPDCSQANYILVWPTTCVGWTAPVGSYPDAPGALGLSDMAGNVHEWCNDGHECMLGTNPEVDPLGPTGKINRVHRGGSWSKTYGMLQCANRYGRIADSASNDLGFRIARTASAP
ncbi:MAG: formylglycine-generating enzyme family protein, partial [Candidatus Eisenbacteria bacterium]|nr:formylglycine-generating enzyme family protein [Candidatus Eisenbacteria bacterium]